MKVCADSLILLLIIFVCTENSESSSAGEGSKAEAMRVLRNILLPDNVPEYVPEVSSRHAGGLAVIPGGEGQRSPTAHKPPSLIQRWKKAPSGSSTDDYVDALKKRQWYVQNDVNRRFPLPDRRKFPEVDWRGFNEDVFHESFGDFTPMKRSIPFLQQRQQQEQQQQQQLQRHF